MGPTSHHWGLEIASTRVRVFQAITPVTAFRERMERSPQPVTQRGLGLILFSFGTSLVGRVMRLSAAHEGRRYTLEMMSSSYAG